MKITEPKSQQKLTDEWDQSCSRRHAVIEAGQDISLLHVTVPCILNEINQIKPRNVLDIGCGTGYLTHAMAEYTDKCIGIDISKNSIEIATQAYANEKTSFLCSSVADYRPEYHFDVCVSCMALSCDPNVESTVQRAVELINDAGFFLLMIPHPCFWPKYWNVENESWFSYSSEMYIEHSFPISLVKSLGTATYIHRTLEFYINTMVKHGLIITEIREPYPVGLTPEAYKYEYPRFLFIKCKKSFRALD